MTDAHVHIERGPYTRDWILRFVEAAQGAGVDRLCLLEHTHRFLEFAPLYEEVAAYSPYQAEWLSRRMRSHLGDYLELVDGLRGEDFPVELSWGLEVCWIPGREAFLVKALSGLGLDFLTGSVHWIDGWGFDHSPESWVGRDLETLWRRYYRIMAGLVESGLFDRLAHPDSLKCFGLVPAADLGGEYRALARAAAAGGLSVELSAGLHNNYNCEEIGPSPALLTALREAGASLIPASDAHRPEDVGRGIRECAAMIEAGRGGVGQDPPPG